MSNDKVMERAQIIDWFASSDNKDKASKVIDVYASLYLLCNNIKQYGVDVCREHGYELTCASIEKKYGTTQARCVAVMVSDDAINTIGAVLLSYADNFKQSDKYANASAFIKLYKNGEIKDYVDSIRKDAPAIQFNMKAVRIVASVGVPMSFSMVKNTENENKTDATNVTSDINSKTDKKLFEKIESQFGAEISKTIEVIKSVYTGLFASGYGVIEPDGLMCDGEVSGAFLYLSTEVDGVKTGISRAKLEETSYLDDVYNAFKVAMGIKESNSRIITLEQISKGYNYFPYKLLEFAFGKCASDDANVASGTYKRHSNSKMWHSRNDSDKSGYLDAVIVPSLRKDLANVLYAHVKSMEARGINVGTREGFQEVKVGVQSLMESIIKAYCPCVIVSENSEGRFKVRISDIDAKLTHGRSPRLGVAVREKLKINMLDAVGGTMEKGVDPVNCVQLSEDGSILEFEVIRNSKLCGAVPLFAYKALDKLKEQGETVSWDNIILGRAEDDSVYMGNNGSTKVNFNGNTVAMHISAGSRSGKGVMTLNILASALASNIPVFYLDSKPDVGALMRGLAPNCETFAIQGGTYDGKYDDMKLFSQNSEIVKDWKKNIPTYALNVSTDPFGNWTSAQYFKALDFCIYLMSKVGTGELNNYGINVGTDNMVVVVDELWRFLNSFTPLLNALKAKRPTDSKVEKNEATDLQLYAKKFTDWQYEAVMSWKGAKNATLRGNKPTLIIIYQELEGKTSKTKYGPDVLDDGPHGNSSVYRALLEMGTEALVGYSKTKPHEITKTAKGSKYLTYANRYFAYVGDIENQTESDAEFFKPFLILNNSEETGENNKYVEQMKGQMRDNGLNVDKVLEAHRCDNGELRGEMGFANYIKSMGNDNINATLKMSLDIAYNVLEKMGYFRESGNTTVFEYLFDMRPEYLLTWGQMNDALLYGSISAKSSEETLKYEFGTASEFFGEEEPMNNRIEIDSKAVIGDNFDNRYAQEFSGKAEFKQADIFDSRDNELIKALNEEGEFVEEFDTIENTSRDIEIDNTGYVDNNRHSEGDEIVKEDEPSEYYDEANELEVSFDGTELDETNKPLSSVSADRATYVDNKNPRRACNLRNGKQLDNSNCIDCRAAEVSPFMERMYSRSSRGILKYRKKLWGDILKQVSRGEGAIKRVDVALVKISGNIMFVNKKILNLSGIIGGDTAIDLCNIVNFEMLFKEFPGIVQLMIDKDVYSAATIEYNSNNPEDEMFKSAKTLMSLYVVGFDKPFNRADILAGKRATELEKAKKKIEVGNEISAMCMVDKEAKILNNKRAYNTPAGFNQKVALFNATKSNFGRVKNNLVGAKKKRPVRAAFWGLATVLTGAISVPFWAISKINGRRNR